MRAAIVLMACAVGALWAPTASASSAVLLPRAGGSGVAPTGASDALDAAHMVLLNEGWRVHRADEVEDALPDRLAVCGPDDACAHELRSALGVDVAVGVRVWGDGAEVDHLAVVVTGVRGVGHRAVATVTDDSPLPFAMAEALRAALALWSTGRAPEGARGAEPRGEAPAELAWEATALNAFLGGLFVFGSAPMLGYAINTAARDGDCLTPGAVDGTCVERVRFGNGAGTFLGIGAVTLAAGVVFLALQPIRIWVRPDADSASLHVAGTF